MNFKINQFVYDSENKEFVKITNGIPVVEGQPEITPTEGIAMRMLGVNDKILSIGYTYRRVNPEFLCEAVDNGIFDLVAFGCKRISLSLVGRV